MKNKFYVSLLIWIGLTLAATPSLAKTAQATKKPSSGSSKAPSSNKKPEPQKTAAANSSAKTTAPSKTKSTTDHQAINAKDSKHNKPHELANHQDGKQHGKILADTTDNKHGKGKTHDHDFADSKNHRQGKDKEHGHELANSKLDKHGKTKQKYQQLADAKDKHGKHKHHQAAEENSRDDQEEDSTTAVYEESSDNEQAATNNQTSDTETATNNQGLANAPKTSPLVFPPLPKQEDIVASEQNAQPNAENTAEPFITGPSTQNNNNRIHTFINQGEPPQSIINKGEQPSTMPLFANKRVHTSIAGNNHSFIDNNNHETSGPISSAHGIVDSSLISAGEKAGLSQDMMIELTDIFAWDIDFANNLQTGDQFTVIYEQTANGKATNRIIAAQFVNRGKIYTAIRYKDKEGIVSYYTPDGRSLRKAFLTTPIDFARVSSPFSTHRRHPILNRIRAHKGVDYAARTGTPVKAAGDGVITFHGTQGGYGHMIVISHGEHYETAYAHLSNFRKDLQDGEPVKQGDVIGYVGQSGLATGPHLHYEFRVDGVHRDPEKMDSKQGLRLAGDDWDMFHAQTVPVMTQLNQAKSNSLFAKNP